MWLRRLVGIVMIVTCFGMIGLAVIGIFSPEKKSNVGFLANNPVANSIIPAPSVTLSASPETVPVGGFSALAWTSTNNPDTCKASGTWQGVKTAGGAESTGRISTIGDQTYTITCTNKGGESHVSVVLHVVAADVKIQPNNNKRTATSSPVAASYCSGRIPCYGARDISTHASSGNCWGWNGDRVINISGFDAGFHKAKSGISSIEISQVCGVDLGPSLRGSISAGGQTRDHNSTTKSNSDQNEIPYFVGYFDGSKP